jgi:hypothetical protein
MSNNESSLKKKRKTAPLVLEDSDEIEIIQPKAKTSESAPPKAKRASINDWPGLATLIESVGDVESVTCVDPGTRNLAITRFTLKPTLGISHAMVISLSDLCKILEHNNPKIRLRSDAGTLDETLQKPDYKMQAELYALRRFVEHEARIGSAGCFDSTMMIVEEQSFDRLMARVESVITNTYSTVRGEKSMYQVLPSDVGSQISAAQVVTARSVKCCYGPLFPAADDVEQRPGAFGIGDVRGSDKQRREHKKAATKFGSMILSPENMRKLIPAKYCEDLITRKKVDDFYDTVFMLGYWVSTYLFKIYKIRKHGVSRALPAFEVFPQREKSRFEELLEIAVAFGIGQMDMTNLLEGLYGSKAPII